MGLFFPAQFLILYFFIMRMCGSRKRGVGGYTDCLRVHLCAGCAEPVRHMARCFPGRTENTLSTIGNTNWLCGYLSVMMPAGTVLFWGSLRSGCRKQAGKQRGKIAAGLFTAAAFLCAAIQGSDSGLLVMGTALSFLFLISCRDTENMDAFWDVF